jgi:hypothetical protein
MKVQLMSADPCLLYLRTLPVVCITALAGNLELALWFLNSKVLISICVITIVQLFVVSQLLLSIALVGVLGDVTVVIGYVFVAFCCHGSYIIVRAADRLS